MGDFILERIGPYEVAALLTRGEGRAVHLVRDAAGRRLVLKLYERGEAEAACEPELLLLGVRHPGLATPLDAGRTPGEGRLYAVFEYVDGRVLGADALAGRTLSPDDRVQLAARLLAALAVVHDRGLLHRDVKADNVVLEAHTDRPVLLDFGLCLPVDEAGSAPLSGTPYFMAPELFGGRPASIASDLWAAGLLLAEALLGRGLFVGGDTEALADERRHFAGLTETDRDTIGSAELCALVERLLSADPGRRPEDAHAALAALPLADDRRRAELHGEELAGSRSAALASHDPRLAWQRDTLRRGIPWHELFPTAEMTTSAALARLVRWIEGAPTPGAALRVRLAAARDAPPQPAVFAGLLEALGGRCVLSASLLGVRDDELLAERRAVVERLSRTPGAQLVEEPAPSADECRATLRAWLGPQDVLEARLTDSVPRSWGELDQALAELARTGAVVRGASGVRLDEGRLPPAWPLHETTEEVPLGPGPARTVLELLASSPVSLPAAALAEVAGHPVVDALQELCSAGQAERRRSQPDDLFSVADGRLRRALLAGSTLSPDTRVRMAVVLEREAGLDEGTAAAIVDLLGEAPSEPDDETVGALVLRAADVLRRVGRLDRAAALLRRGLAGCASDAAARRALLLDLADVLVRAGDYPATEEVLARAREHLDGDGGVLLREARLLQLRGRLAEGLALLTDFDPASVPREDAVLALQQRSDLRRELGQVSEALTDLREALRRQGDAPSRRAITLLDRLGGLEARQGRPDAAIRHFERAIAMAREIGHEGLVWGPLYKIGRTIRSKGERRRGLAVQEEAAALAEAAGQKAGLVAILNGLGAGWLTLGRVDVARRHLARALELARELGDVVAEAMVLNNSGRSLAAEGRHEEAETAFAQSLALRAERGDARGQAAVALTRGGVRAARGRLALAQEDLDLARECLAGVEAPDWEVEADLLAARLALSAERTDEARACAARARERAEAHALGREAVVARDLLARAGSDDLEPLDPEQVERGPWLADLLVTRALALASAGRGEPADADLDAALSILGETPDGGVEARAVLCRAGLDLDRLEGLGQLDEQDAGRVGALVSRVSRDLTQAGDLVAVHGLDGSRPQLEALRRRQAALDLGEDMSGLAPLAERMRNLERLVEINKQLNTERDTQKLLDLIVDSAIELTGAARGFIILFEGKGEEFRAARNIDESTILDPQFQVSHSVARKVAREGQPLLTANAIDDPRLGSAASITELKLLSILCVPLVSRGRILGAVYLDHPQVVGRFLESHQETVTALAEQAAIALENARLSVGLAKSNEELVASKEEIGRLNDALEQRLARREAELEEARESLDASRRALALRYDYSSIVTRSPRMHEVLDLMDRVTSTDFPVVIYGESGTGKELMARAIHFNGRRAERNFLSINCAAIAEPLIESELFGSVRGAFTGADRDRKGLFAQAHEGTLFLDEIGDMSLSVQKRLLRVLQEGEFLPVGGRDVVRVDVRILCATHRNLKEMVEQGGFREDLYYRLAVGRIDVPPLRDRPEDIALLLPHFLERHGGASVPVEPEALQLLEVQRWAGNVRELENLAMNLLLFGGGSPVSADLVRRAMGPSAEAGGTGEPADPEGEAGGQPLKARLEAFERRQVSEALERAGGNKSQAARALGVSVRSLYKMLERLGL